MQCMHTHTVFHGWQELPDNKGFIRLVNCKTCGSTIVHPIGKVFYARKQQKNYSLQTGLKLRIHKRYVA